MIEVGKIQRNKDHTNAGKITELDQERNSLLRLRKARDNNEFQKALGHSSETITCSRSHTECVLLKGKFNPCQECALEKERQANVSNKAVPRTKITESHFLTSDHHQSLGDMAVGC